MLQDMFQKVIDKYVCIKVSNIDKFPTVIMKIMGVCICIETKFLPVQSAPNVSYFVQVIHSTMYETNFAKTIECSHSVSISIQLLKSERWFYVNTQIFWQNMPRTLQNGTSKLTMTNFMQIRWVETWFQCKCRLPNIFITTDEKFSMSLTFITHSLSKPSEACSLSCKEKHP